MRNTNATKKEKMVTRTFTRTIVDVKVYNLATDEIGNITVTMIGELTDRALEKELAKTCKNLDCTVLKVLGVRYEETLYGVPESQFIAMATVLPNR